MSSGDALCTDVCQLIVYIFTENEFLDEALGPSLDMHVHLMVRMLLSE